MYNVLYRIASTHTHTFVSENNGNYFKLFTREVLAQYEKPYT